MLRIPRCWWSEALRALSTQEICSKNIRQTGLSPVFAQISRVLNSYTLSIRCRTLLAASESAGGGG